jgi:hypothetical protein
MPTPEGARVSQIIHRNVEDMKNLCRGVDEETASRAPDGRWSPKQIISHLCGPEGSEYAETFSAILEQDTPRLDIEPENPFFSEKRGRMALSDLLAEFERKYVRIATLVEGLSEEQLHRKAHIPLMKESPLGEYPTLAGWAQALGDYHLAMHIGHMREILEALGVASGSQTK